MLTLCLSNYIYVALNNLKEHLQNKTEHQCKHEDVIDVICICYSYFTWILNRNIVYTCLKTLNVSFLSPKEETSASQFSPDKLFYDFAIYRNNFSHTPKITFKLIFTYIRKGIMQTSRYDPCNFYWHDFIVTNSLSLLLVYTGNVLYFTNKHKQKHYK